ncbi:MAG: RluA family pseudouridine synthase [Deltaproteobacteria bacterium]|nr:RluA family pseudouridine synthase [Deltaproteobacteria bacterium]
MPISGEAFTFTIEKANRGKRLDLFLAAHLLAPSRAQIQRYLREGCILLNAAPAKAGTRLKEGDLIQGQIPAPTPAEALPEELPIRLIYEDADIVVVDKPPGMAVHPAGRMQSGTLVNALLFRLKDLQGVGGVLRPGIVHRLDKGTSGVMVVAKNDQAHDALVRQFKGREVKKRYLALVYGRVNGAEGTINAPLGRHPIDRKRFSLRTRQPKEALTEWQVKERFEGITLVQVAPRTGRTHQIRVHMASINHPLVGDPLYTKKRRLAQIEDPVLRGRIEVLGRQALHASSIAFRHPTTGKIVEFAAPLAADIEEILEVLRGTRV